MSEAVKSFPARGLVVPVIRALVTLTKIEKERARYAPATPPEELDQEMAGHAIHLAHTIEKLAVLADARDRDLPEILARLDELAAPGITTTLVNSTVETVVAYCNARHDVFREAFQLEKEPFRREYRETLGESDVLLLHGQQGEPQATTIAGVAPGRLLLRRRPEEARGRAGHRAGAVAGHLRRRLRGSPPGRPGLEPRGDPQRRREPAPRLRHEDRSRHGARRPDPDLGPVPAVLVDAAAGGLRGGADPAADEAPGACGHHGRSIAEARKPRKREALRQSRTKRVRKSGAQAAASS
jgi:hypothetical protein